MNAPLPRRLACEALGTAFLLMAVVGSGIMGEQLDNTNQAVVLLANSLATGCALAVLILIFAPVSGAHFNPAVSLCMAFEKKLRWREAAAYILTQIIFAYVGVAAAHLMFEKDIFMASGHTRDGGAQWFSEFIATFGLMLVILSCMKQRIAAVPFAVAAYITAAYWFTSSTSFANPAVTLARAATDTFSGIRPKDVLAFIAAQLLGAVAGTFLARWLITEGETDNLAT